jgi:hypothetical protein
LECGNSGEAASWFSEKRANAQPARRAVSHGRTVEGKRGHRYRKPFTSMRTYLGADHLCIQVFDADPHGVPMRQWKELATALR